MKSNNPFSSELWLSRSHAIVPRRHRTCVRSRLNKVMREDDNETCIPPRQWGDHGAWSCAMMTMVMSKSKRTPKKQKIAKQCTFGDDSSALLTPRYLPLSLFLPPCAPPSLCLCSLFRPREGAEGTCGLDDRLLLGSRKQSAHRLSRRRSPFPPFLWGKRFFSPMRWVRVLTPQGRTSPTVRSGALETNEERELR